MKTKKMTKRSVKRHLLKRRLAILAVAAALIVPPTVAFAIQYGATYNGAVLGTFDYEYYVWPFTEWGRQRVDVSGNIAYHTITVYANGGDNTAWATASRGAWAGTWSGGSLGHKWKAWYNTY